MTEAPFPLPWTNRSEGSSFQTTNPDSELHALLNPSLSMSFLSAYKPADIA